MKVIQVTNSDYKKTSETVGQKKKKKSKSKSHLRAQAESKDQGYIRWFQSPRGCSEDKTSWLELGEQQFGSWEDELLVLDSSSSQWTSISCNFLLFLRTCSWQRGFDLPVFWSLLWNTGPSRPCACWHIIESTQFKQLFFLAPHQYETMYEILRFRKDWTRKYYQWLSVSPENE